MGIVGDFQASIWKNFKEIMPKKSVEKTSEPIPQAKQQSNGELIKMLEKKDLQSFMTSSGKVFVRIAGIFGATAVIMGAYGAHGFYLRKDISEERKKAYETANHYHFLHSLALLTVPLTKRPLMVGTLLTAGMSIFCGSCYIYALTDSTHVRRFAPYGGTLLILAWLSMIL
ncbi:transmembrane protein 256 homolog [Centruroides sculpturatus]|uniref:transmembrane protein 256 homolog n=1 Tax=Centruroides sculpturatus TaxID=218467 RepID=UPI000C6D9E55|nr:transmembrane protein 256 homolog [Centruroides sculpturatus]